MSYELSFSDEFYSTDGDANGVPEVNSKGQPRSLHSAIVALLATPSRERARLCASMRRTVAYLQEYVGEVIDRAREILGMARFQTSDYAGAASAWRRYLELEPTGEWADSARKWILRAQDERKQAFLRAVGRG